MTGGPGRSEQGQLAYGLASQLVRPLQGGVGLRGPVASSAVVSRGAHIVPLARVAYTPHRQPRWRQRAPDVSGFNPVVDDSDGEAVRHACYRAIAAPAQARQSDSSGPPSATPSAHPGFLRLTASSTSSRQLCSSPSPPAPGSPPTSWDDARIAPCLRSVARHRARVDPRRSGHSSALVIEGRPGMSGQESGGTAARRPRAMSPLPPPLAPARFRLVVPGCRVPSFALQWIRHAQHI